MTDQELAKLEQSPLFRALQRNKKAQVTFEKLGAKPEWKEAMLFIQEYKIELLENMFNDLENTASNIKHKNQIIGMERVMQLPEAIKLMKEIEKQKKAKKLEEEEEARRRKYNPGNLIKKIIRR